MYCSELGIKWKHFLELIIAVASWFLLDILLDILDIHSHYQENINLNKIRSFTRSKYIASQNSLCSDLLGAHERIYFD